LGIYLRVFTRTLITGLRQGEHLEFLVGIGVGTEKVAFGVHKLLYFWNAARYDQGYFRYYWGPI